jgi:hypothetical protein
VKIHRRLDPLALHRVPPPPPELAAKVLSASAIGATPSAPSWVDRLWESSGARLLWAATLCLLLLGHVLATRPMPAAAASRIGAADTIASVAALLEIPASALRAPVSRFRVPRFDHAYDRPIARPDQIARVLEETSW